jgi:hypothetical protein
MRDLERLSTHAEAEIAALTAEGIALTPEEIVRINALAWAVETPGERMALSRGVPVFVAGVALWPLTMAAHDWISRVGARMPTVRLRHLATAYAMAHAYATGPELDCDGAAAVNAVSTWAAKLRCRPATIDVAAAEVLRQDEEDRPPPDEDAHGMGLGDLSAWLSSATGLPAAEFERRMSFNHALRVFHYCLMRQDQAEGRKSANTARIDAERAMGLYLIDVRRRHNGA